MRSGLNRVLAWHPLAPDSGRFTTAAEPACCPKVPFSHLDKGSQGRIDDLGAPDPIRANMSLRSHDYVQAI
jgi:hypothetical protein